MKNFCTKIAKNYPSEVSGLNLFYIFVATIFFIVNSIDRQILKLLL